MAVNSIRRSRRRPRVRSVNYRTLWWVLTREAAIRVCDPTALGSGRETQERAFYADSGTHYLVAIAENVLRVHPARQFFHGGEP